MNSGESASNAVAALRSVAERIRHIEAEARHALYVKDDPEAHRQKLQEKTMLLMELPDLVDQYYEGMAEDIKKEIETGVKSFALRASQAWELSSIFYMSALLYPEDYREGDRNDLELFVDRLRIKYLS
jgi:hypothetical protein